MSPDYQKKYRNERIVIDYIAGMTDRYAIQKYKEFYIPQSLQNISNAFTWSATALRHRSFASL